LSKEERAQKAAVQDEAADTIRRMQDELLELRAKVKTMTAEAARNDQRNDQLNALVSTIPSMLSVAGFITRKVNVELTGIVVNREEGSVQYLASDATVRHSASPGSGKQRLEVTNGVFSSSFSFPLTHMGLGVYWDAVRALPWPTKPAPYLPSSRREEYVGNTHVDSIGVAALYGNMGTPRNQLRTPRYEVPEYKGKLRTPLDEI
jgi:hypothetical protein